MSKPIRIFLVVLIWSAWFGSLFGGPYLLLGLGLFNEWFAIPVGFIWALLASYGLVFAVAGTVEIWESKSKP